VAGTLYLVGTPIGNLGDLSDRARETLAAVDLVAAEDTRRTGRLLRACGIRTPLRSLFEGNERARTMTLLDELRADKDVALVSDAGMPSLSDPGFPLVRACVESGIDVRVVPGPSAAIAALVVSGLPTDRFAFEGFAPRTVGQRRERLRELRHDPRTVVLFESPRRVSTLLRDVLEELGDRRMALARELTKLHEEVLRGSVSEVLALVGEREPRGEVVVVIEGATQPQRPDLGDLVAEARGLVEAGWKRRRAATEVAHRHGVSVNDLYTAMLDQPTPTSQT
jgi:16S rRNA (cytidine1402-2'-O)-methyltransferase